MCSTRNTCFGIIFHNHHSQKSILKTSYPKHYKSGFIQKYFIVVAHCLFPLSVFPYFQKSLVLHLLIFLNENLHSPYNKVYMPISKHQMNQRVKISTFILNLLICL